MKMGAKIVLASAAFVLIITAVFLYFDRVAILILEKRYNLEITYRECSKNLSGRLDFTRLSITYKPAGLRLIAKNATIKPAFIGKNILLDFNLRDLYFAKKSAEGSERYDTLAALVSSPFNSRWKYRQVRGQLEPLKNSVRINNLDAIGDQIRLSIKGDYFYSGTVDSDIVIYFTDKLADNIPPEFAKLILANEKGGWRSLSVHLTGDPNKPSIQVSSKLFRLSIKSVSGS